GAVQVPNHEPRPVLPPSMDTLVAASSEYFSWNSTEGLAALNLQFMVSKYFAITGGMNYTWGATKSMIGGNLGLALMAAGETFAFRIDGGVLFQPISYRATTVVITETHYRTGSSDRSIGVFDDHEDKIILSPYAGITFNSTFENSPVNFFVNGVFTRQPVASFKPEDQRTVYPFYTVTVTDERVNVDATAILVTPGLIVSLFGPHRLLVGARWTTFGTSAAWEPSSFWMPFVQLDIVVLPGGD
ncbi:MAG: hypothetical protein KAJ12_06475, partial [Bacteroidetes bacterium]|nr:hypothetical protein [Bacteroidota bacterium]